LRPTSRLVRPLVAALAFAAALAAPLAGCGRDGAGTAPPARSWTDPGEVAAGEWTLYYNAFPSTDLQPAMAEAYAIRPRPRGAVVTVSLVRGGDPRAAADAQVEIAARTLLGQPREVRTRRIARDGVVSWLGELDAGEREQLVFTVRASVPGGATPIVAEFRREFHADD
jgi:predicted small lipoprotein YifL